MGIKPRVKKRKLSNFIIPLLPHWASVRGKHINSCLPYAYVQKSYAIIILVLFIFILSSCNYFQEFSKPKITTLSSPKNYHIKTIAILPFKNFTDNEEAPITLRKAIFSNLSLRDYDLIKLKQVDQRLQMASYHITDIGNVGHYKLGKLLDADALIYGTVTKCSKLYGVVYSRVAIGAEIEMVDASNSKTIWKANHVELTHSGTPPFSPFSIPEKIVDSTINIRGKVINDTADRLARKFVDGIPEFNTKEYLREYNINIKNVGNRKEVHYKVQRNDTLFMIARKFYGHGSRWRNIKYANGEIEGASLKVGHDLVLPDVPVLTNINDAELLDKGHYKKAVYKVKWGDSLYNIAYILYHDGTKWRIIYEDNKDKIENIKDLTVGQVLIIPLNSYPKHICKSP
ncbi:MAG: GNA1162 family protein [Candidatus Scalinduaceae bacterium]